MLALILAAAVAAAPGAPAAAKPSTITQPDWLQRPSAEDMANYYPKAAADAHIEGRATLHCRVTETGVLTDCTVTNEQPTDQGFGAAALNLAPKFKMRPMTKDGAPVPGGRINIPIRFQLPAEPPFPSVALARRCYAFAAAAAERNPNSQETQLMVLAWRMVLTIRAFPENMKPSEFDQMIEGLRSSGMTKLDDPAAKADREECAAQIKGSSSDFLRELNTMARQ